MSKVREAIAVGSTIVAVGALSGCDVFPGSDSSPSPSTSSANTSPAQISVAPTQVKINAPNVVKGPVAAQKDAALTVAYEVDDVIVSPDEQMKVADARAKAQQLGSPAVKGYLLKYVDARLAATAIYTNQDIYTFDDQEVDNNTKTINIAESAIGLIDDLDLKKAAESELEYSEAKAALDASGHGYGQVAQNLISRVIDPGISSLLGQALGGNTQAAGTITSNEQQAEQTLKDDESAGFEALYNGSNDQADRINKDIQDYYQALQKDGN